MTNKYPRVTPEDIDEAIENAKSIQQYHFPGTTVTVVCVELSNGFCVIGKSAAVSPENFDALIGWRVAMDDVRDQLWELLGYGLKEKLNG